MYNKELSKIHFIIILPSTPRSFQWSLSLSGFPTKTLHASRHKIQAISQHRRISSFTTEWLMGITTAHLTLIFMWCFTLRTAYVLFKYRCDLLWIQSPDCQLRSQANSCWICGRRIDTGIGLFSPSTAFFPPFNILISTLHSHSSTIHSMWTSNW